MENENHKQKIDLMKSIMSNPKMARQFKEAMSAPIGSTKREQAKSLFSIMKKVSGLRNDGMGGPTSPFPSINLSPANPLTQPISNPTGTLNTSAGSNYYIFPPAGKMKTTSPTTTSPVSGLKLSPVVDNSSITGNTGNTKTTTNKFNLGSTPSTPNNNLFTTNPIFSTPSSTSNNYGLTLPTPEKPSINTGLTSSQGGSVTYSAPTVPTTTPTNPVIKPSIFSLGGSDAIKTLQIDLNAKNKGLPGWKPLDVDGKMGPLTAAAQTFKPTTTNTNTNINTPVIPNTQTSGKTFYQQLVETANGTVSKPIKILGQVTNINFGDVKSIFASQESGDNYNTKDSVAGAMGKYQLMPFNLGYAGLTDTPENRALFRATPALQDKAYDAMMSELYTKYDGDIAKIAAAYYGGSGAAEVVGTDAGNAPQKGGPSVNQYVSDIIQKIPNIGLADTSGSSDSSTSFAAGPYSYASNLAQSSFGGRNLTQVISDNTSAYLKALEPLELNLSNLKAESENFVPTLTSYIEGRDKYSKAIDKMIASAEDDLLSVDMSDPASVDRYNNYTNYLYTLKGRQSDRYGNYLKSAIADYNAEVTKVQSNYDTFKTNATQLLTQQNAIDQASYNDIMTRGQEQWTALDGAEMKAYNMGIVKQQYYAAGGDTAANGITGAVNTNPKLLEDKTKWLKELSIDKGITDSSTGNLDITKIGPGGLINLYETNSIMTSDQRGLTEALRQVFATTLSNSGNDPKKVAEIQKLISQLRDSSAGYDDTGKAQINSYADALSNGISTNTTSSYSGYILTNIGAVKQAMKDLVSTSGGFLGIGKKQPGIQDKAKWIADHSSLDSSFLEVLYNAISSNVQPGTEFEKNPSSIVNQIFSGKTDQENADNLASIISIS